MKQFKRTMAIGLLALSLCLSACGGGSGAATTATPDASAEPTQGKEEFRVGLECNYAPFNWTQTEKSDTSVEIPDGGGYADGYDVQIAKRIADGLGKELVIVKTEWDGLIPAVNSGKVDAVIAGMSPTAERAVNVDFTDPYYESELVIVVKKGGAYAGATSLSDFAGAKITGQLNTLHYNVIDQIQGVKKQNAMDTFPAMIVALNSGKIDGYVSERPGAVSAMASNPDLTYVKFEEGKGFSVTKEDVAVSVALKKGSDEMVQKINDILAGISQQERETLMQQAVENQPVAQ